MLALSELDIEASLLGHGEPIVRGEGRSCGLAVCRRVELALWRIGDAWVVGTCPLRTSLSFPLLESGGKTALSRSGDRGKAGQRQHPNRNCYEATQRGGVPGEGIASRAGWRSCRPRSLPRRRALLSNRPHALGTRAGIARPRAPRSEVRASGLTRSSSSRPSRARRTRSRLRATTIPSRWLPDG